ncbi:unnamed protein product [Pieris brassicae]|uniref:Uncharacterized protein n=1 Tax=Pieris brassicae TaxID=7116 RepID=A0A9P0XGL1_PIEBR|nr:unnamed protein product [Pieris brassicae]
MESRFPNLTDLLYQQNLDRITYENEDKYENDRSTSVSLEEEDTFGVDLSGKNGNLGGKSFTIAAILGLTKSEKDVMNLSVQERLQQNQKHLENYLYSGHDVQRINDGFCRIGVPALRQGIYFLTQQT